ncbi:GntR family transcriptional regulator [Neorhizobium galegae]|uniref:GntR family transcriptional regulator n=1 Tax=Neorhizobium galegae TaxID=399 RepID=UPI000621C206|nr:GntR family transcriptional regulator [Neorhizobium galegae]CDZ61742.1 Transcriptional regulator, GntR family [Neorhizobium galegae bv. orientalis]KAB1121230.1 GntR family transcriptional regulator [Neorhizobium galegae]MCQ1571586.1 GntR family transcriptional regulator [Neorhizobium galegae]MCQ1807356.1 GntR family transcriptional regulator [Neorhizobium galegae]MCQ1837789.1 GntR family transcriptional regulator [Neorhizobium galegae]
MGEVTAIRKRRRVVQPAKPASLTEQVYDALRTQILTCVIRPGQELNEAEVAERFDISKTPAREALAALRQEGLVRSFPRRGYQVTPITFADMDELFDVRTILEAGAAELACTKLTPEQIDRLNSLADATYNQGEELSLATFIRSNREFHLAIAEATGNGRLVQLLTHQIDALERFFYLGAQLRDVNNETSVSHHQIVETLARRDQTAAREIMIRHNEQTRQGLFQALATGRGYDLINL